MGRGRAPKFLSRYLPKIRVFRNFYPDFSFREPPWASADFRGQCGGPSPHILLGRRQQCISEGDRGPKTPGQYLPKIRVSRVVYPNFSSRHLPSASVDNGKPSPHILSGCRKQCILDGNQKPNFTGQYLPKVRVFSADYFNFALRQPPWASADCRRLSKVFGFCAGLR